MYHKSLGRVHWFLWHLSPDFKKAYRISYDYATHSYCLLRSVIIKSYDIFIVVRTSKRCFRVTYHNFDNKLTFYRSFSTSRKCAEWVDMVFRDNIPARTRPP